MTMPAMAPPDMAFEELTVGVDVFDAWGADFELSVVLALDKEVERRLALDDDVVIDEELLTKLVRLESIVKLAVRPVTFVQREFGVPIPKTKLTAAH